MRKPFSGQKASCNKKPWAAAAVRKHCRAWGAADASFYTESSFKSSPASSQPRGSQDSALSAALGQLLHCQAELGDPHCSAPLHSHQHIAPTIGIGDVVEAVNKHLHIILRDMDFCG